jgi:hypothetical protein
MTRIVSVSLKVTRGILTDVEALGVLSDEPALFLFFFLPLCCSACSSCSNNRSCCCNFRLSRSDISTPKHAPASLIPAMGVMSRLVGLLRDDAEADRASVFSSSGSFVLTASLPALLLVARPVLNGDIWAPIFLGLRTFGGFKPCPLVVVVELGCTRMSKREI